MYDTRTQSIMWERGRTQFLQQTAQAKQTKEKKRVNYYRLKEVKEMYQSNALGGSYMDLILRVNVKSHFWENQCKRFSIK